MKLIGFILLLALAACDKPPKSDSPHNGTTPADSVEDLLAKLPAADPTPVAPVASVQTFGRFGTNGAMPGPEGDRLVEVDAKAVAELNIVASYRVESAFAERQLDPAESVIVQFGGEEADGLLVTIRYQGKSVSRSIAPANNGPELVSNLDHTVDRLLDELGVARRSLHAPP